MSKSPKYSVVADGEARRRKREQQRQARERKRREEEAARARERLKAARKRIDPQIAALIEACAALAADPFAQPGDIAPLTAALDRLRTDVDIATSADDVFAAIYSLHEIDERRRAMEANISRRRLHSAEQQVAELRQTLADLAPGSRLRFDATGVRETDAKIDELTEDLRAGRMERFAERANDVVARVDEHRQAVASALAHHVERREKAGAHLEEQRGRHALLASDARQAGVVLEELAMAEEALEYIASKLEADAPTEASELASRLALWLDSVERELDAAIDRVTARREILMSITDALPGLGFAVDPRSLVESPDGSIGLQAHLRTGDGLAVIVQDGGAEPHRISYLREGSAGIGDHTLDASSCSSLTELATKLNDSVRREGFTPGRVTWDDDPGDGPSAVARQRPDWLGAAGHQAGEKA